MKFKASKKRNNGFTLVEMLAVTAIVAILLAIGIVAVVYYARWLHITELDNTAREIYLAAENRAVLLSAGGRLEEQVKAAAGGVEQTVMPPDKDKGATPLAAGGGAANAEYRYIYYSGDDSQLADLLPVGTIDPALREGYFYIVYEVNTGSVTDVFYAEDGNLLDNNANFQDFYETWRNSSRQVRLDATPKRMIGYYGGEAAGNDKTNALKAPILIVHNEEELWVELTYEVPTGEMLETRKPVVKLYHANSTERQYEIDLELSKWNLTGSRPGINGTTYTYKLVLDSLEAGKQFKDLYNGAVTGNEPSSFGWDFTVEAWIEGGTVRSPTASDTGNSLFADETHGSDTAYIGNLRHLQNLDKEFSKVEGKTAAVQIADIEQSTSELEYYKNYEFKPIVNDEHDELKSYCGSYGANGADSVAHFIKGLTVTADSAAGKSAGGLFATVPSGMEFQNVHLINTYVEAKGDTVQYLPAGALVGVATDTTFTNCWVYWEGEELEELKASIDRKTGLTDDNYQIIGTEAGGLVGQLNGGTITDCLAATLVKGTNIAGGLVGQTAGAVTVQNSYADCYLKAPTAAGLIGTAGGTVTLTNVYTAGFIDNTATGAKAAGLCNGNATANYAYSAMHYKNTGTGVNIVPLAEGVTAGDKSRCYYLGVDSNGKLYENMIEQEFLGKMGTGFEWKYSDSHPYSLLMDLTAYPFPGLENLPHYGDWNAEFVKPALVYFEKYQPIGGGDAVYGFFAEGLDTLKKDTEVEGKYTVPLDGYAVAFREEDLGNSNANHTITFTYRDKDGNEQTISQDYKKSGGGNPHDNFLEVEHDGETYYLAVLPDQSENTNAKDKLINRDYASENFYQPLGFRVEGDPTITWAAYCPHFAKTARPISGEETANQEIANMAKRAYGYVRTPRHLRALSRFETYAHGGKYDMNQTWVSHTYTYTQELDLDYETYEGYGWKGSLENNEYTQDPIGRFGAAFNGNYDGGCHTIKNVKFALLEGSARQYAGLFGLSAGSLRNIVYLMNPEETISVSRSGVTLFLGALAGGNSGTIDNCAVAGADLKGTIYNKAEAYVGGLVGINNGAIQNCAAEVASLKARGEDFSTARAGGLVGRNNGTIRTSYAVGHISGEALKDSSARVCGFVGYNTGSISYSYTATRLESSGAGVETFGFCGEKSGSQDHTYFVDSGNFTYRGEPYNGTYSTGAERADPVSYRVMTGGELAEGEEKPELVENGMAQGGKAEHDGNPPKKEGEPAPDFPLPTGVTKNGQPVHYGQWPEELDLGLMGIYYWEKMELPGGNGVREIYGVSMLAVDPNTETVKKISTLSNAHSDGGKVVDYGYGYYVTNNNVDEVKFETEGIHHTVDGKKDEGRNPQTGVEEIFELHDQEIWAKEGGKPSKTIGEVNDALNNLMEEYTFFSFRSFVPNPDPNKEGNMQDTQDGLYTTEGQYGKFGLTQKPKAGGGEIQVNFELNPHFADAMGVESAYAFIHNALGQTIGEEDYKDNTKLTGAPGSNGNPYEVRAMGQLSAINWNSENLDTKTVINGNKNNTQFPYLSYGGNTRDYVWKQTHDIHGNSKTYTPIAEYFDNTNAQRGTLAGWFGGSFNGDDYVIENVNIQGQASSVAGLFGVVFNGALRNIVLYSSDGEGTISNTDKSEVNHTTSMWYSMGALAGVAAASNDADGYKGYVVENCSASGYTIQYRTYNKIDNGVAFDTIGGGSTIGGLLGSSDMALKNCTAVTQIQILKSKTSETLGNDNLRAGGLTGVCQNSITNCYAGGSIEVTNGVVVKNGNDLYLGGIVGGGYFKPVDVKKANKGNDVGIGGGGSGTAGRAALTNCYSYVELPSKDTTVYMTPENQKTSSENPIEHASEKKIKALYAIGGQGDGDTDYSATNCYYLESEVMKNNLNGFSGVNATDIPYVGRTVTLSDGSTRVLTPNDVNGTVKEVNGSKYSNMFTRNIIDVNGTVLAGGVRCRLEDNVVTIGKPVFTVVDENGNYFDVGDISGNAPTFKFWGWLIDDFGGNFKVTNDPATFYSDPMPLTYKQLAGTAPIEKDGKPQDIYGLLPDLHRVTDSEDGFEVPGKYSYGAKEWLTGLRYPFPTILTRQIELGKPDRANVHYGDWPLNGIERVTGGAPIRLDLLKVGGEVETEVLTLSAEVPEGGTWKIETKEPAEGETAIIEAYLGDTEGTTQITNGVRECRLTVNGLALGQTSVTVTYVQDGVEYGRVTITVNVTATLRVKSELSPIYVFPGAENVKVPLVLCDDEWNELTAQKLEDVEINLSKSVCRIPEELLSSAALAGDKEGGYYLFLKALPVTDEEKFAAAQAITVSVPYTYKKAEIEAEHSMLPVVMRPLPKPEAVTVEDKDITRITFAPLSLDEKDEAGEAVTANITVKGVTEVSVTEPTPESGSSDDQTTDPEPPEKPEGTVTFEGNVVTLKGYVPGTEVTLTLDLATKRSGADTTEQPTTQTVTMTVTIPKPEPDEGTPENPDPEKPEDGKTDLGTKQAENQETVEAAEPEPTQVPEPAAGEEAKLPEGPDPALPVEEKTDPVPEKDAGAGEDGTEPEQ